MALSPLTLVFDVGDPRVVRVKNESEDSGRIDYGQDEGVDRRPIGSDIRCLFSSIFISVKSYNQCENRHQNNNDC